jgi:hypothetical protein
MCLLFLSFRLSGKAGTMEEIDPYKSLEGK